MPQIPNDPNPAHGDALAEAAARARQTADAFATVFGVAGKRSSQQEVVLAAIASSCSDGSDAFQFRGYTDGIALVAAGLHRDGAQSICRLIERQCSIAQRNKTEPPKPGVKVKK